jgi:hypothetical protein
MNNRRALILRAIRGPVLLITIGVLFALHQASVIPIERTWPLLIIVLGLMILLERVTGPRVPYPPSYPSAGGPMS